MERQSVLSFAGVADPDSTGMNSREEAPEHTGRLALVVIWNG